MTVQEKGEGCENSCAGACQTRGWGGGVVLGRPCLSLCVGGREGESHSSQTGALAVVWARQVGGLKWLQSMCDAETTSKGCNSQASFMYLPFLCSIRSRTT